MEQLRLQAIMATDRFVAFNAIDALGGFGEEAIPDLLKISGLTSLADDAIKAAANREIDKIKRRLKP
jgi:hypothetical protein